MYFTFLIKQIQDSAMLEKPELAADKPLQKSNPLSINEKLIKELLKVSVPSVKQICDKSTRDKSAIHLQKP